MASPNSLVPWMLMTREGPESPSRTLDARHLYQLRLAAPKRPSLATRLTARLRAVGRPSANSAGAAACCPA